MPSHCSSEDEDPAVIGQALLDLAARLPEGYRTIDGGEDTQSHVIVSYDAGDQVWEIEFCALDPSRNFTLQNASLEVVMRRAIQRDREAAPSV